MKSYKSNLTISVLQSLRKNLKPMKEFKPSSERPIFNPDIEPVKSSAEMAKTLVSLPMPSLTALLKDASEKLETPWLQCALAIGTFDFSREIARDGLPSHSLDALDAALSFIHNVDKTPLPFDEQADFEKAFLSIKSSPAFNAFFLELVAQTIQARQRAIDQCNLPNSQSVELADHPRDMPSLTQVFGRLLLGACALDLPQAVRDLVECLPKAATTSYSVASISQEMARWQTDHAKERPKDFSVTPYFYAMQINRAQCMQAMQQASGLECLPLAYEKLTRIMTPSGFMLPHRFAVLSEELKLQQLDVIDSFKIMTPVCSPGVLTAMLIDRLKDKRPHSEGGPNRQALHTLACQSISDVSLKDRMDECIPSFLACGAYKINPTECMMQAIANGLPKIVESLSEGVDWGCVFNLTEDGNGIVTRCIFNDKSASLFILDPSANVYPKALYMAAKAAVNQGDGASLIRSVPVNCPDPIDVDAMTLGSVVAEPMASLVKEKFNDTLLVMMEAGLATHQPLHPGTKSLLEMAEIVNPELVDIIASFQVREQCRSLINNLESPTHEASLPDFKQPALKR